MQEAATRHAKLADIGAGETEALKAMDTLVAITNEWEDNYVHTPEEVCVMLSFQNSLCRVTYRSVNSLIEALCSYQLCPLKFVVSQSYIILIGEII